MNPNDAPEKYYNVSHTQLSIARYYGGMTVNGVSYTYNPVDDTLTRDDILKVEQKEKTKARKTKKAIEKEKQLKLYP